jgi:chaperonin GroEL
MAAKQIVYGDDARQKMLIGINKLAAAVTTTLGPRGRNVAIDKSWGSPTVIHDGVSVAKEISLEDKFENMGAQLVKEAANKTNEVAGDGTTTATLLAQHIAQKGMKYIAAGGNPMMMKRGIDKAVEVAVARIREIAKPVDQSDWEKVATISAQNEVVGKKIAEALSLVGKDGVIEIEEGKTMDITIDHKKGMVLDKGYASPYFVSNTESMEAEIKSPYILITDQKVSSIQDLLPLLESFMKVSKDLVIIADDIDGEALTTLILNKLRGAFNILAVKAPGFGDRKKEMLQDIAVLINANLISADTGRQLKDATLDDLGRADSVRSNKDETVIVGGKGSKKDINARVAQIEAQVTKTTSDFDKEKLIEIGASTEIEMKNLQERAKDAKGALKAAIEEGIIPGGGVTYIQAAKVVRKIKSKNPDEQMGIDLIAQVLEEPLRMLAKNSGVNEGEVIYKIKEKDDPSWGFDVMTNTFGDMVKAGVIEPAKVEIAALQNAASVASMILTTECLITDAPEDKKAMPAAPDMGGMM